MIHHQETRCRRLGVHRFVLSRLWLGLEVETGNRKVTVKGEHALYHSFFHKHERNTIGEADALIGVFLKKLNSGHFIAFVGAKDRQRRGFIHVSDALCSEFIRRSSGQQRGRFIQHEVTGEAAPSIVLQPAPVFGSGIVILIALDVTRQEGTRVDENHDASPYR